jgi:hypothetical protein
LHRWNFTDPAQCEFHVESLRAQGSKIPEGIEEALINDLFVPEDFEALVLEAAADNAPLGKLLRELQEPRPTGYDCIPWLGETSMKERILRLCARGKIAINLRGTEYLQAQPGEDEDSAWRRLRPKLSFTGRQLDEVFLLPPSAVPATGGTVVVIPPTTPTGLFSGEQLPGTPPTEGQSPTDNAGTTPSVGPDIFGGSASSTPRVSLSNPATSPLNLIGKLETWGIGPATQVAEVNIKVSSATGAQVKDLLKKLPDGMTFELSLEKEES